MMLPSSAFRRLQTAGLAFSAAVIIYTVFSFYASGTSFSQTSSFRPISVKTGTDLPAFQETVDYFLDYPVRSPFKDGFGDLGRRSRILRDWLLVADSLQATAPARSELQAATEQVALNLFPFLETYIKPNATAASQTPMADLRASFDAGSAGIVIPTGDKTARFASHLIASLRSVLGSTLPIQVVYAGDGDLSPASRATLASVVTVGAPLEFLDLDTVFPDDTEMELPKEEDEKSKRDADELETRNARPKPVTSAECEKLQPKPKPVKHEPLQAPYFHFRDHSAGGGWAFKSFAALASRFEKVILLDADAVFLQPPETMFAQEGFQRTGALMFHDRLLWKNSFAERHEWWHDQIRRPSAELQRSLVWTERYAEEGDSGAVVLDKGRLDVLMGLLHTCWQNTYRVRQEVTYKMLYGDKESWWMGQELAGAAYAMEAYYGAMVGWEKQPEPEKPKEEAKDGSADGTKEKKSDEEKKDEDGTTQPKVTEPVKVCSFVIAHVDEAKKLLWYNGSLMKNKALTMHPPEYEVPQQWMVGGTWHKGARKQDMSCMSGVPIHNLTETETGILQQSIDLARQIDEAFAYE